MKVMKIRNLDFFVQADFELLGDDKAQFWRPFHIFGFRRI
jgi:hypothetical protein